MSMYDLRVKLMLPIYFCIKTRVRTKEYLHLWLRFKSDYIFSLKDSHDHNGRGKNRSTDVMRVKCMLPIDLSCQKTWV